jgi:hypothetical protein
MSHLWINSLRLCIEQKSCHNLINSVLGYFIIVPLMENFNGPSPGFSAVRAGEPIKENFLKGALHGRS